MKYYYLLLSILIAGAIQAQIVNIPDSNFKQALIDDGVDQNNDGEIQVSEAEVWRNMHIESSNISSLEGIEFFIDLRTLFMEFNNISSFDPSNHPLLTRLSCKENNLTTLDFSDNDFLEQIDFRNNQISTLTLEEKPMLFEILADDNLLTEIDVSQCPNLTDLKIYENPLSSLDVTQNPELRDLRFAQSTFTSIDLSNNNLLLALFFYDVSLDNLDLTNNENIHLFLAWNSQLTTIDLSSVSPFLGFVNIRDNANLQNLNIANGENMMIDDFIALDNPNLFCIQVDDIDYANNQACINNETGWCKDNFAEYSEKCILGIEENDKISVAFYPNPVQDMLKIRSSTSFDFVEIHSIEGKLIRKSSNNQVDISDLSSGLYIISIYKDGQSTTMKFLKS